ncbi:MAG: hypothetical protein MR729_04770 [Dorea sp.]|nr:hypothetical protein [Dorea sp.]
MKSHLLIISSVYLSQYLRDMMPVYADQIEYRIIEYRTFKELKDLYYVHEKWADGILTTGIVVETVLKKSIAHISVPIISLATDNESFYRIPLSLMIENRNLSPERIVFDVFLNTKPYASVYDILEYENIDSMFPDFSKWLASASLEELYTAEDKSFEIIRQLWEDDRIDMVICRYGNLVPRLKALQIPCVFATSSNEYLQQTLELLMTQITVDKLTAHAPAVISISPSADSGQEWTELLDVTLQKELLDFAKKNDLEFLIQKKRDSYLILTEKTILSYLTQDFQKSILSNYLNERLDFPLVISYGIGNTLEDAIEHAATAFRSSKNSGYSYLVNADNQLTGPLYADQPVITSYMLTPQIQEIALQSSLSASTIHRLNRLILLLGRREITSTDLAENFHITTRGANRILQKLESSGLATTSFQRPQHTKGRPTKVYHIDWEI